MMSSPRLRILDSQIVAERPCSCRAWHLLNPFAREMLLADVMEWAQLLHQVRLSLLLRGERAAIRELSALRPGRDRSHVLAGLLSWADCALIVLELTPSPGFGSDVDRITKYAAALGFEANLEPQRHLLPQEALIRYPKPQSCQLRL